MSMDKVILRFVVDRCLLAVLGTPKKL